jgi:hypothetical protein
LIVFLSFFRFVVEGGKLVQNYAILLKKQSVMRKFLTFLLLALSVYSFGQYTDNFADGDFINNPTWSGNTDKFVINSSKQLQLQASAVTSTAYLATASTSINNAVWQFSMKAGLLLTSGNYIDFYLVSDNADLSGSLNGYYVMMGNTGKEVALYRQTGTTKTKLVAGVSQRLPTSGSSTEITVKVTRDAPGNWTLSSKLPSETDFITEGTTTDATCFKSSYSGIFCNYSSTNSTKYYFDDFSVTGDPYVDNIAPSIVSYGLTDDKTLTVNLSEAVTLSNAVITVPATLGTYKQTLVGTTLTFAFATDIPKFQSFVITLDNVQDLAENALPTSHLTFGLFPTTFGDVIFNEIMCDPLPVVGLPEAEYIELYNRKNFSIDLTGWKLYYGTKSYAMSGGTIAANGYLLLCAANDAASLSGYSVTATMSSFPSLSATGQLLYLTNEKDSLIAFVDYSNSWYNNDFKTSGGWSLECIDSENRSEVAANWAASCDLSGGTPGHKNSVAATVDDTLVPRITAVSLWATDTLLVQFNKSMLLTDAVRPAKYTLDNGLTIKSVTADYPQGKWVKVAFLPALQHGTLYGLSVSALSDVDGQLLTATTSFGVPDSCEYNDLVINEILAHPRDGGAPFVEMYNRSQKIVELKKLWLNRIKTDGSIDIGYSLSSLGQQLLPQKYVVLTTSREKVCNFYTCKEAENWIEMSTFVPLPDASGNVLLINRQGLVIDSVEYAENRHDATINNPQGVSFERVNPDWASTNTDNWHSAASDAGYATPGYRNSQYRSDSVGNSSQSFWLETKSFTPDNDGVDDLLLIRYKMPDNGYSATVTVYDAAGRRVKRIAGNAVLGSEGTLVWNGTADNTSRVNIGVYLMYIDAVSSQNGKRETAKLACVVAAK